MNKFISLLAAVALTSLPMDARERQEFDSGATLPQATPRGLAAAHSAWRNGLVSQALQGAACRGRTPVRRLRRRVHNALLTRHLADIVRSLDTTRPITAGCNEPSPDNHLFKSGALDIIGFNYHHQWIKDAPTISVKAASPMLKTSETIFK